MRSLNRDKDTICALATAHGLGAISVVRLSGPRAAEIIRKIAAFLPDQLESHKIYYGVLKDIGTEQAIDEVLVASFASGRSFTGECSFEISCHGSEVVVDEILRNLVAAGARPAERGEFTYRAFMNGRMDLVQAESVLALIESRSKRASALALRQLKGGLSKVLKGLCERLTWVLAQLEANIDFASEDIEIAPAKVLAERTRGILDEVRGLLASYPRGRLIQSGFHVLLVGRPNAGKSSLLNALGGEDRAIVTAAPGTTRDFVEAEMEINGVRVTLVDTAGLRVTDEMVEKIGVERTLTRLASADRVLYVVDSVSGVSDEDRAFFTAIPWDKTLILANKCDLNSAFKWGGEPTVEVINVSAATGEGLDQIKSKLGDWIGIETAEDSTLVANARHFQGLTQLAAALETALPMLDSGASADLTALELQQGLQSLYEIMGLTYDDQVMDRVFSEFCLGK